AFSLDCWILASMALVFLWLSAAEHVLSQDRFRRTDCNHTRFCVHERLFQFARWLADFGIGFIDRSYTKPQAMEDIVFWHHDLLAALYPTSEWRLDALVSVFYPGTTSRTLGGSGCACRTCKLCT